MEFETIRYEMIEDMAVIRFNRPDKKNAISLDVSEEVGKAVDLANEDKGVRFIVLTGAGEVFSSGADFSDPAKAMEMIRREFDVKSGNSPVLKLVHSPKPTIAAVNGYALGHGAEYALMCDIIIASEQAEFGFIGPVRGAVCPYAMIRLADEIGRARAKELIITCERISALEAFRIGLVNKVAPAGKLMDEVSAMAGKMRRAAPLATRYTKEVINRDLGGYELSAEIFEKILKSDESVEGAVAFLEKRNPRWYDEI
ncbi:MAG TPA: enoyl-CoA hydratase/isomerase family protein [Deltaproteobacteria bacterium]|nr:enoyl-CoA hydratase/isomerase family protein [Deltaproteobacteria bacterium]